MSNVVTPAMPARPMPILLDTDIGTDIDDVYALIIAAVSPEFDLRAVSVVNNDVSLRARIARRVLDLLGRQDVPVSVGAGESLTAGETRGWMGHEGRGIDLSATPAPRDAPPAYTGYTQENAALVIARCAEESAGAGTPLTVCPIGAMTNLALALREYPEQAKLIGQVIAMAADFRGYGPAQARLEHNIACDPVAADVVLHSGLPITLIGLNVTKDTPMSLSDVEALEQIGGPLAKDLAGMHRIWFDMIHNTRSSMHDGLTLAQQIDPQTLSFVRALCSVITHGEEQGKVIYTEEAPVSAPLEEEVLLIASCQVATTVDAPRYHALLQGRVQEAVRQAKNRHL
jgi:inosine-uridine nucleoside N-ribohydrolase